MVAWIGKQGKTVDVNQRHVGNRIDLLKGKGLVQAQAAAGRTEFGWQDTMLLFEGSGEILLGIKAVLKGDVGQGAVAVSDAMNDLGKPPFADVIGRCQVNNGTKKTEKMKFRIPCDSSQGCVIENTLMIIL